MFTRFVSNVRRWPRVFTVLVMLTLLELGIDFGLCRYIGRQDLGESCFIVTVVVLAVAVVAGITYKLFAPAHQFTIANVLDRIEGCPVYSSSEGIDFEDEPEEEDYEEESTEEDEDENEESRG